MTYIVWFNRKYRRQFEAVVKGSVWKAYKEEYGTRDAAVILVSRAFRIKSMKRNTSKRGRLAKKFILGSITRPDIYGEPTIKIGKSKKAVLDRGHSELVLKRVKPYAGREKTRRKLC
jgi:hypothetical protein